MTATFGDASEAAFVTRLRAGEPDAFEQLVRNYTPPLLRVARRLLGNDDEARDALQDAFISVFRSIRNFEAGSRLSTWLHRVVVNAALMKLRTRRRHPEEEIEKYLPLFQEDGHQIVPSVEWMESAETALQRKEMRQLVRTAIDRLPDTYRTVLLLRDIEEMSTAETAEILGISTTAAKLRLHRARQALRTQLDPQMRGSR
ncbi:MAG: RNA polymerase subunit sigma-24 [Acidobacteria bacterium]|nr:MAG: RNA polymerase subunit sigma-24 [Acidobacteriota bacterium]